MLILLKLFKILMMIPDWNSLKRIKENFDPEILTYLNESIREEIVELLDIKQLATNASELEVDDAVDVIEDLRRIRSGSFLRQPSRIRKKTY